MTTNSEILVNFLIFSFAYLNPKIFFRGYVLLFWTKLYNEPLSNTIYSSCCTKMECYEFFWSCPLIWHINQITDDDNAPHLDHSDYHCYVSIDFRNSHFNIYEIDFLPFLLDLVLIRTLFIKCKYRSLEDILKLKFFFFINWQVLSWFTCIAHRFWSAKKCVSKSNRTWASI